MGLTRAARVLMTMAALATGLSCDAVFGIQQYPPGPPGDGGTEPDADGVPPEASSEGGPCMPGDKRCSGNDAETCGANRAWGGGIPCPSGETCSGGSCFPTPPSCAHGGPGVSTCGAGGRGTESCCTTRQEIPGGTFERSFDGLSSGFTMAGHQATVNAFRLDAYEVTVGRFREFVSAVEGGWLPAAGSGIHTHLNAGRGLNAPGGNETGWDSAWNSNLAKTVNGWDANLSGGTWTSVAGKNENLAIAGINWFEAYAFCIWDQGFLPSEAEWNDAAAGGSEQRARPWSTPFPPGSTSISCTEANFSGCPEGAVNAVGSESPPGDGRWGHSDMVGNVWEWTLDWFGAYITDCVNCADVTSGSYRVLRGGSFRAPPSLVLASFRNPQTPLQRANDYGLRCARTP